MSLAAELIPESSQVIRSMQSNGLTLATVTNISDPESLGRIKCKPVTEDEDIAETDWCFCMTPAGGNAYGFFFFPNVDDLVVLAYLGGDVHRPVVLGSYWAGEVKAPYAIEDGENKVISIKTPQKSEIKFDEEAESEKITITTPSGAEIMIDDENKTIHIKGNDDNTVKLDWENGEIEIKAAAKLKLSAGDTELTLESSGSINGKASNEIGFEANNINLTGRTGFTAEGATAEVTAKGEMKLTASGVNTIRGATVKIN